ncbi:hypothetical protein HMPREF0620_0518 [Parascardovia denticolens DSM 10105 = JCM 12538]|uniref:Uncharacterized protein n=1 Tax=Parascardovia denticolens DSM 10105 = JCM 12538 TaxID=864564 RepID=E6K132_PARDN|nr:hypothetical protein HMPREF0620_0518 [Parascardovia denticolens DSM 10105 = JCM 12538]
MLLEGRSPQGERGLEPDADDYVASVMMDFFTMDRLKMSVLQ